MLVARLDRPSVPRQAIDTAPMLTGNRGLYPDRDASAQWRKMIEPNTIANDPARLASAFSRRHCATGRRLPRAQRRKITVISLARRDKGPHGGKGTGPDLRFGKGRFRFRKRGAPHGLDGSDSHMSPRAERRQMTEPKIRGGDYGSIRRGHSGFLIPNHLAALQARTPSTSCQNFDEYPDSNLMS